MPIKQTTVACKQKHRRTTARTADCIRMKFEHSNQLANLSIWNCSLEMVVCVKLRSRFLCCASCRLEFV